MLRVRLFKGLFAFVSHYRASQMLQSPAIAEQIERLTTEAIDEHEASDYTIARALLARAVARRALGFGGPASGGRSPMRSTTPRA